MHKDVLAIFAQGADPGQGKIGHGSGWGVMGVGGWGGGSLLQKTLQQQTKFIAMI